MFKRLDPPSEYRSINKSLISSEFSKIISSKVSIRLPNSGRLTDFVELVQFREIEKADTTADDAAADGVFDTPGASRSSCAKRASNVLGNTCSRRDWMLCMMPAKVSAEFEMRELWLPRCLMLDHKTCA